jgi:hypothetical protein
MKKKIKKMSKKEMKKVPAPPIAMCGVKHK